MIIFIPTTGPMDHDVKMQLTLETLQRVCGGYIMFRTLLDSEIELVTSEDETKPKNYTASALAGFDVFGPAIMCSTKDFDF